MKERKVMSFNLVPSIKRVLKKTLIPYYQKTSISKINQSDIIEKLVLEDAERVKLLNSEGK
jgi:hypothetical protein